MEIVALNLKWEITPLCYGFQMASKTVKLAKCQYSFELNWNRAQYHTNNAINKQLDLLQNHVKYCSYEIGLVIEIGFILPVVPRFIPSGSNCNAFYL